MSILPLLSASPQTKWKSVTAKEVSRIKKKKRHANLASGLLEMRTMAGGSNSYIDYLCCPSFLYMHNFAPQHYTVFFPLYRLGTCVPKNHEPVQGPKMDMDA